MSKLIEYGASQEIWPKAYVYLKHKAIGNYKLGTFLICAWDLKQNHRHGMIQITKQWHVLKCFALNSSVIPSFNLFLAGSIIGVSILLNISLN